MSVRATAAALVFFALGRAARLTSRQHALAALAGLLGIAVNQLLFIHGLSRTTAVNSTVLATTIPVWTLLFSIVSRSEPARPGTVAGIGVAFAGALVVTGAGRLSLGDDVMAGNLLLLCSTSAYAAYLVVGRRLAQEVPPLGVVPWIFLYGALFSWPLAVPSALASHVEWTPRSSSPTLQQPSR